MQPLWADFNACDNDGAVLMGAPPFLDMHLRRQTLYLLMARMF